MVSIVSKELHFDEELKKKIEFICDFCNLLFYQWSYVVLMLYEV